MKRNHLIVHFIFVLLMLAGVAVCRFFGWVEFFSPLWLLVLLALPLVTAVAVKGISGLPSHVNALSATVRALLLILLVLCLAGIQIVLQGKDLSVLFLLDHSASIPQHIVTKELEYVNAAADTKAKNDTAGIVILGENASVEMMPQQTLNVERIHSYVGKSYTDLQGAIELAVAAFKANTRKKIVLITDGNENKGSILEGIKFAAANQVVTDILPVTYEYSNEVLIEKVHLPDKITENETFDLKVHVSSLRPVPAELAIYRNGVALVREKLNLKQGRSSYTLPMKIEEPGFYTFTARISTPQDSLPENNEASGYVYIQGSSRILLVAPSQKEVSHLAKACRQDSLEADIMLPEELPASLGMLQNYDCVVLANVPADSFSQAQMSMLQANVRDLGVGLVMIGGENSFGAGGYEDTPIEEALPVTMDIKQKKINPKGALVLILHTCEFPNGNYWAKQITKKAIETVNSQDEVGVLIYGMGGEEWLFNLRPASDKNFMYAKIDQCSPGDMPSFEPTIKMAYAGLTQSDAMVKHMIIISDGDPASPQPQMIKNMAKDGITISTIAINPHSPRDVDIMKYLAYTTGGRYYFAGDPKVLPKIFIKEAKVVKRSLIFNKQFQPQLVLSTEVTKGINPKELPPLMAYVASTPKPRSLVPIISDNENEDPVLAYWRYGLGKAVAFTSDSSSNWGKHWVSWDKYKKFWTQVIRWSSRKREKSPLRMHTEMHGNRAKLIVDAVDNKGSFLNFLKLNGRLVGPDNQGKPLSIRQTAPGRYEADFDASAVGVNIINVGYQNPQNGAQGFVAMGVSIPYSLEYRELESNISLLQMAAAAGGGRLLTGSAEDDEIFTSSMPPARSFRPIWEYLMIAALIIFFVDVILRRVIITRDDIAEAFAKVRSRLKKHKVKGERDSTMDALLKRKAKTFEKVPSRSQKTTSHTFKDNLRREAEQSKGTPELQIDAAREAPSAAPSAPARKDSKPAAAPGSSAEAPAGDEDSYTGRLLAAKRRARAKNTEDEE